MSRSTTTKMSAKFREGFTHAAGTDPGKIVQGEVVGVNMANWTVDIYTKFDNHHHFDVQVGSPYLHYNNGEGVFAMPEVGAQCIIGIPGDSSPPAVLTFVAPPEVPSASDPKVSFSAGRPHAKPGDIFLRTRDGNFITLHRGGVVQIGATELSQRIYIPLGNHITDVSENYSHHNASGSIVWGIQEGPSTENIPSRFTQTFRVHANDKYADVRVSWGKVMDPHKETGSASEILGELTRLGFGKDPTVCEVLLAPGGFEASSGNFSGEGMRDKVKYKYFFDRVGNVFMRAEGNVLGVFRKEVVIYAKKNVTVHCDKTVSVSAKDALELEGKAYVHVKGGIVKLGPGTTPVARQGDPVIITIPVAQLTGLVAGAPFTGVMTMISPVFGSIMSGSAQVLA